MYFLSNKYSLGEHKGLKEKKNNLTHPTPFNGSVHALYILQQI